ncbi:Succinate-semialdehyde dehydrogenase [NADP(+)] GabD [Bradyrhizobium ivorense]|nr:Succinate-semialdehyde dehydrogenase [NADP(+)] GabD [Bradyrhizobium ivorense]
MSVRRTSEQQEKATNSSCDTSIVKCIGNFNKCPRGTFKWPCKLFDTTLVGLAAKHLQILSRRDFVAGAALIGGRWTVSEQRDVVVDPASEELIENVTRCAAGDVNVAIAAAERTFSGWRELLPTRRGAILRCWASLMRDHAEARATLVTSEQGKPLSEARQEIAYGAAFLEWFAAVGGVHTERQSPATISEVYFRCEWSQSDSLRRSLRGISLSP